MSAKMKEQLINNIMHPLQKFILVIASPERWPGAAWRSNLRKVQIENEIASRHHAGFPAVFAMTSFLSFLYAFSNKAIKPSNNQTV